MTRIARPHRPRLAARFAAPLTAGVLLATSLAIGAPSVQATAGVVDLETTALRLSGSPIRAGGTVSSGVTLTPVHLTTADPESSATDGATLRIGRAEIRNRRPRVFVPAVPAEEATFRIDGVNAASSVPDFLFVDLQTDQGRVRTAIFTVGGVSYAIPRSGDLVPGVTRTVASSGVPSVAGNLSTTQYGLLPVGAQLRNGSMFQIGAYGSTSIATFPVYDADAIRGNSDALGEELPLVSPENEVVATVTLDNGATVAVRGLRFAVSEPYGRQRTSWAFDRAALAAAGATIADVTGVVSFALVPHDLSWEELGFDVI